MSKVLVTGASGLLGLPTLKPLCESFDEVHAIYNREFQIPQKLNRYQNLFWHRVDLLAPKAVTHLLNTLKPSHLLHLAWYVEHGKFVQAPENADWVRASIHLFEEFAKNRGSYIVSAGSCIEYDWREQPCREGTRALSLATPYSRAKHETLLKLDEIAKLYRCKYGWGRVFFLYGPGENPNRLVPAVINSVLKRKALPLVYGDRLRDYIYIEDAAAAFVSALKHQAETVFNIGSGDESSLRTIVDYIIERLGARDTPQFLETKLVEPDSEPQRVVAEIKRLPELTGWSPRHSLERGLDETIQWWQTHQ